MRIKILLIEVKGIREELVDSRDRMKDRASQIKVHRQGSSTDCLQTNSSNSRDRAENGASQIRVQETGPKMEQVKSECKRQGQSTDKVKLECKRGPKTEQI